MQEWDAWLSQGITTVNMNYLKDRNRGMILLFLRKILLSGHKKYIPYLRLWQKIDYRKVREAIQKVIHLLEQSETMDFDEYKQSRQKFADSLIVPTSRNEPPSILVCQACEQPFILDETNPDHYTEDGFRLPEECERCAND